jgi:hypothetical protein
VYCDIAPNLLSAAILPYDVTSQAIPDARGFFIFPRVQTEKSKFPEKNLPEFPLPMIAYSRDFFMPPHGE